MKVTITLMDDRGNIFQGQAELTPSSSRRSIRTKTTAVQAKTAPAQAVNLSSPIRAFVKKHAGGMGGPQKFTLLLAHMVGGDTKKELPFATIRKQWGKMTGLLGKWNGAHTIRAKDHEWVDSPKTGMYILLPGWRDIFNA